MLRQLSDSFLFFTRGLAPTRPITQSKKEQKNNQLFCLFQKSRLKRSFVHSQQKKNDDDDDSLRLFDMTTTLEFFICSMGNTIVACINPIYDDGDGDGDGDGDATGRQLLLLQQYRLI